MLKSDTRRRLKEHGWLEIAKRHSNPHLALNRLRDQAIEAIDDLTLLAQKLPTNILNDIFNYKRIGTLTFQMLKERERISDPSDDSRRIRLAALLVSMGISQCANQYASKIEQNSVLNEAVSSQLSKAVEICNEISYKIRAPEIEAKGGKDLGYLFNWSRINDVYNNRIEGEETWKFYRFCEDVLEGDPNNIIYSIDRVREIIRMDDDLGTIRFIFSNDEAQDLTGDFVLDWNNNLAYFRLEKNGKMRVIRTLVIKREHKDVYVFERKKESFYRRN